MASLTTFNCPLSSAGAESWRSRLPSDFQEELRRRSRNETVPPADTPTTSHASDVPSNSPFGPGMHLIIGPCQALAHSFLLRMLSLSRLTKKKKYTIQPFSAKANSYYYTSHSSEVSLCITFHHMMHYCISVSGWVLFRLTGECILLL